MVFYLDQESYQLGYIYIPEGPGTNATIGPWYSNVCVDFLALTYIVALTHIQICRFFLSETFLTATL